ncbi:MAG: helix-turn-helix transcriptional regulator [Ruminococcaceae bacterium]|nr:helix-turn-helix transcriptional regulator [Oscillospiraceae bacterium]
MDDMQKYLDEQLKNPEFKKEYDALEPEFALIRVILDARREKGITQKELSERTGIAQGDISKLENGSANPSVKTLKRVAAALGKKVKIEFV